MDCLCNNNLKKNNWFNVYTQVSLIVKQNIKVFAQTNFYRYKTQVDKTQVTSTIQISLFPKQQGYRTEPPFLVGFVWSGRNRTQFSSLWTSSTVSDPNIPKSETSTCFNFPPTSFTYDAVYLRSYRVYSTYNNTAALQYTVKRNRSEAWIPRYYKKQFVILHENQKSITIFVQQHELFPKVSRNPRYTSFPF